MTTFIIIAVIVFIWIIASMGKSGNNNKPKGTAKPKSQPEIRFLNRDGDSYEDEWHTYIAGINYRAKLYDVGGFIGWVEWDSSNTHDSKAMGIYTEGKLLGYIPADERDEYREWCDGQPQPCIGVVYIENGQYRGRVKILRPCNQEFIQTEFERYGQWISKNHGKEYLPKETKLHFTLG